MQIPFITIPILMVIFIGLILFIIIYFNRKIKSLKECFDTKPKFKSKEMTNTEKDNIDQKNIINPKQNNLDSIDDSAIPTVSKIEVNQAVNLTSNQMLVKGNDLFKLTQTRIQGHSHKKSNPTIPCQDFGKAGILSNGYHVIIVSDGAGSSKLSHIASEFCVNTLFSNLQVFDFTELKPNTDNPELLQKNWKKAVSDLFGRTRNALLNLAKDNNIQSTDLYCTLLLVIKTEWGFLSANIGDGRSGVSNGKPHALSVPLQTFTAGATFFLIKEGWENIFRSYITPVTDWDKIKYFFATTDGCQDFVMDWSEKGPRQGIYDNVLGDEARYDYNAPYEPFFDGLISSLNEVTTENDRNERLKKLVEKGIYINKGVEKELKSISDPLLDDDKTLIIFHK